MRNKKPEIALCILLALLLALTACSTPQSTQPAADTAGGAPTAQQAAAPEAAEDELLNELGVLPLVKKPYSLTFAIPQNTQVEDYATNKYTTLLEEKSGIKLNFEFLPATDAQQKVSVMISGGTKLPDIFCIGMNDQQVYTFGTQGYFLALNDYYENSAFFYHQAVEEHGLYNLIDDLVMADGNIYSAFGYNPEYGNEWDHRAWINKTWLDTLGLDIPETTEEYYTVLKAFKDQDPNGNGQRDEIPYMGHINGWNSLPQNFMMNAFTYFNDPYNYIQVENGKLSMGAVKEEWRQGLEYMNRLYSEGLMSPLTFTQDRSQFQQIIEDPNAQLVGSMTTGSMSIYQTDSVRKQDMVPLPPLTGPNGVSYSTKRYQGAVHRAYITKDAADPEVAFRLLDLMYEADLSITARYGEQGVNWEFAGDAEKGTGLYESMDIPATIKVLNNQWGQPRNCDWGDSSPALRPYKYGIGGMTWNGDLYDSQYMTAVAVPMYIGKAPEQIIQKLALTTEENDRISETLTSLRTYIDESTQRFIVGDLPLSEWDNYIKELENIGLQEYMSVIQTAYDRAMADR